MLAALASRIPRCTVCDAASSARRANWDLGGLRFGSSKKKASSGKKPAQVAKKSPTKKHTQDQWQNVRNRAELLKTQKLDPKQFFAKSDFPSNSGELSPGGSGKGVIEEVSVVRRVVKKRTKKSKMPTFQPVRPSKVPDKPIEAVELEQRAVEILKGRAKPGWVEPRALIPMTPKVMSKLRKHRLARKEKQFEQQKSRNQRLKLGEIRIEQKIHRITQYLPGKKPRIFRKVVETEIPLHKILLDDLDSLLSRIDKRDRSVARKKVRKIALKFSEPEDKQHALSMLKILCKHDYSLDEHDLFQLVSFFMKHEPSKTLRAIEGFEKSSPRTDMLIALNMKLERLPEARNAFEKAYRGGENIHARSFMAMESIITPLEFVELLESVPDDVKLYNSIFEQTMIRCWNPEQVCQPQHARNVLSEMVIRQGVATSKAYLYTAMNLYAASRKEEGDAILTRMYIENKHIRREGMRTVLAEVYRHGGPASFPLKLWPLYEARQRRDGDEQIYKLYLSTMIKVGRAEKVQSTCDDAFERWNRNKHVFPTVLEGWIEGGGEDKIIKALGSQTKFEEQDEAEILCHAYVRAGRLKDARKIINAISFEKFNRLACVLELYAAEGKLDEIRRLTNHIMSLKMVNRGDLFKVSLRALASLGAFDDLLRVFNFIVTNEVKKSGVENIETWEYFMKRCRERSDGSRLVQLYLAYLRVTWRPMEKLDGKWLKACMNAALVIGDLEAILALNRDLLSKGASLDLETHNKILKALAQQGHFKQVLRRFERMLEAGIEPNERTLRIVADA